MMLGYVDPQQNAECFDAEGFFLTGDLGCISPEKAITITGRKKDLINRGGEKISAKEVEEILYTHASIDEVSVVGMPHSRLGETVCAYAILKPGKTLTLDDVVKHVSLTGVAKPKYPERLVVVDSLPRTASGKVRKDQLRIDIRQRLAAENSPAT
jgi:non-ribosomal peptide synthetase component E (peptide arylation enzyme)